MDGRGVPQAVVIAGANTPDHLLLPATLDAALVQLDHHPEAPLGWHAPRLCLDKGYAQKATPGLVAIFGYEATIEPRHAEAARLKRPGAKAATRSIVERTISWLNRSRRLLVRWDKRPDTYLAFLHIACAHITWRNT